MRRFLRWHADQPTDFADEPTEVFDRVTAINLRGVLVCMKHELGQMRTQGSCTIVNCSSIAGLVGGTGRPTYTASKRARFGAGDDHRDNVRC